MFRIAMSVLLISVFSALTWASGASQEAFVCDWFTGNSCAQDPGFGKVIWVQPAGKNKVNVTYVLTNLNPGTDYQLGIKIFNGPGDGVNPGEEDFGQLSEWSGELGLYDIYMPGIVTADFEGDASFHINIKNIQVETWCGSSPLDVIFFIHTAAAWAGGNTIPISGTDSNNDTNSVLADLGSCAP